MTKLTVIGTTDDCTVCECCGRSGLKMTVVLRDEDGNVTYYGRSCAARATGRKASVIGREILAADHKREQARQLVAQWGRYVAADGTIDTESFRNNNRGLSGEIRYTHEDAAKMIRETIEKYTAIVEMRAA